MKSIQYITILLVFITTSAIGQSVSSIANQLVQLNLIDKGQKEDIIKALNKTADLSSQSVLMALKYSETIKLVGNDDIGTPAIAFENTNSDPGKQEKTNVELRSYLNKLKQGKYINNDVYSLIEPKIDSGLYVHKLLLIQQLIDESKHWELFSPEHLLRFAEKLHHSKIVSDPRYEKLVEDIKKRIITNGFQILTYCEHAVIIKENNYPLEPENYLEQMHKDVSNVLPELVFSDFKFQTELDTTISDNDNKFYDFRVSLISNGKTYRQKSSYHLYNQVKNQYYGNKIDRQEFYKLFNKILTDNESLYRLHLVKAYSNNAVDWTQFGIIVLTKEQEDAVNSDNRYFSPGYEDFKNTMTTTNVEHAISEFQKTGLLNHLTKDQIRLATENALEQENTSYNDVLQYFPNTIYFFDTELANLDEPYEEILNALSAISKKVFKPTAISDNFATPVDNKAWIKFTANGKQYAKELEVEDDWIDPGFFELVKQVLTDNKLNGQFYELYTGGQEGSVIFLTNEQYQYMKTNKLLLFSDQWQTKEE